ncbi:hypothetical protein ROZALSC1DRAFT_31201 [Rozella allomycis CSF55]|uniref:Uncharacterized protein n=1 Tax=Rozella allomycis (strain CSF55) TaxID=988480 RepID=A0A075AZX3_ROZAC|nr:hypothetical protein O9G_005783 [Rozella allomycis CSF55]RKP16957.1 hypothetical protein ROZALSC1DRAFT_31201 [Rozella allomycis CSF55]|eukprot:EPZ35828.1 hypothetical protein O9G_005783 [Rozella allomycis CSF55]
MPLNQKSFREMAKIVVACVTLHNLMIDFKDNTVLEEDVDNVLYSDNTPADIVHKDIRHKIAEISRTKTE